MPANFVGLFFMKNKYWYNRFLWLIALLVFLHTVMRYFFAKGMFFDGVTYAAVAEHWSVDLGSTWLPHYHNRDFPFYAHPPLLYVLLGSMFRVLGSHWWVENVYNAIVFIVSLFLSIRVYRTIFDDKKNTFAWLWIALASLPLFAWTNRTSMMENTVTVFSLMAVWFVLLSKKYNNPTWLIPAGSSVLLGFLTKGPVALFPLFLIFIYDFSFHTFSYKTVVQSFYLLALTLLGFSLVLLLWPDAISFFKQYWQKQVFNSVTGSYDSNGFQTRLQIFLKWILELLPFILLSIALIIYAKKKQISINYPVLSLFFFLALSASLPLLISAKQRMFYLVPSLPFFAMAFAALLSTVLDQYVVLLYEKIKKTAWSLLILGWLCSIAWMLCCLPKYNRDEDIQKDIEQIVSLIPKGSLIGCDYQTAVNWPMVAYFARIGRYTISDVGHYDFYVSSDTNPGENWRKENLELRYFSLYSRVYDN